MTLPPSDPTAGVAVLLFGGRRLPRALRDLPVVGLDDIADCRRVVVVGSDADLAAVLTHLLRADRLDVEVGHVRRPWNAHRARTGKRDGFHSSADETGTAIVGAAHWLPPTNRHEPSTVKPSPMTRCCSTGT